MIQHIPTAAIDETALARDRSVLVEAEMVELRLSVARAGVRLPIEVFPLAEPAPPFEYGLISGYRRLAAVRTLAELSGDPRWDTIPALVREPASLADAVRDMVEENAVRAAVSPWEQGRIALLAREQDLFPTIEAAVDALYPTADKAKRSRIRAVARLVEALEHDLTDPERLGWHRIQRLSNAVRDGFADPIRVALAESKLTDAESQWRLMESIIEETEDERRTGVPRGTGRPRRVLSPRRSLTIRREKTPGGYLLRFTGPDATSALMDTVFDEIERLFGTD